MSGANHLDPGACGSRSIWAHWPLSLSLSIYIYIYMSAANHLDLGPDPFGRIWDHWPICPRRPPVSLIVFYSTIGHSVHHGHIQKCYHVRRCYYRP